MMTRFTLLGLVTALLCLSMTRHAHADPSFDCQKATQTLDRLICRDSDLAKADSNMARAFTEALRLHPERRAMLIAEQRAWLARRSSLTPNPGSSHSTCLLGRSTPPPSGDFARCIEDRYGERLEQLQHLIPPARFEKFMDKVSYKTSMRPGEVLTIDYYIQVHCLPGKLQVFFGADADGFNKLGGRGIRESSWVECPVGAGHEARFKVGLSQASGPHMCGAAPAKLFSIWINGRKAVAGQDVGNFCEGWTVYSVTIGSDGQELCKSADRGDELRPPTRGGCTRTRYRLPRAQDESALLDLPPDVLIAGPSNEPGVDCARMIDPRDATLVRVPAGIKRPTWTRVASEDQYANLLSANLRADGVGVGTIQAARFDLFGDGKSRKIYAFATASIGFEVGMLAIIPTRRTPFIVSDPDHLARSGIYSFDYNDPMVFFSRGLSYILLDPVTKTNDARVVRLRASGKLVEVCRLHRRQEAF